MNKTRYAVVMGINTPSDAEQVRRYLPDNYRLTHAVQGTGYIEGRDVAGWTLDAYVIPRLASGLWIVREIT